MRKFLTIILLMVAALGATNAQQIYNINSEILCAPDSSQVVWNFYLGYGKNGTPFFETHSYTDIEGNILTNVDPTTLGPCAGGSGGGGLDSLTIDFIGCGRDTFIFVDTTVFIKNDTTILLCNEVDSLYTTDSTICIVLANGVEFCDTLTGGYDPPCPDSLWVVGDTLYMQGNDCDIDKACFGGGLDSLTIDFMGCQRDTNIFIDTTIIIKNDTTVLVCDQTDSLVVREDSIICLILVSGVELCDTFKITPKLPCTDSMWIGATIDTLFHRSYDCTIDTVYANHPIDSMVQVGDTIFHFREDGLIDTAFVALQPCRDTMWQNLDSLFHLHGDCSIDTMFIIFDPLCPDSLWSSNDTIFHQGNDCKIDFSITQTPCTDSLWSVCDTMYHRSTDCSIDEALICVTSECVDTMWASIDTIYHQHGDCSIDFVIGAPQCFDTLYIDNKTGFLIHQSIDCSLDTVNLATACIDSLWVSNDTIFHQDIRCAIQFGVIQTKCVDSLWVANDTIYHQNVNCDLQKALSYSPLCADSTWTVKDTLFHQGNDCSIDTNIVRTNCVDSIWWNIDTIFSLNVDCGIDTTYVETQCTDSLWVSNDTIYHRNLNCDIQKEAYICDVSSYISNDTFFHVSSSCDTLEVWLGASLCKDSIYEISDTSFVHIHSDCSLDTVSIFGATLCVDSLWAIGDTIFHKNVDCKIDTVINDPCAGADGGLPGTLWLLLSKCELNGTNQCNTAANFPGVVQVGDITGGTHPSGPNAGGSINGWNAYALCSISQPADDGNNHYWIPGSITGYNTFTYTAVDPDPLCGVGTPFVSMDTVIIGDTTQIITCVTDDCGTDCDTISICIYKPECVDSIWLGVTHDSIFHLGNDCQIDTLTIQDSTCLFWCDNTAPGDTIVTFTFDGTTVTYDTTITPHWGLACDTMKVGNGLTMHTHNGQIQIDLGGILSDPGLVEHDTYIAHDSFNFTWNQNDNVFMGTVDYIWSLFPRMQRDSFVYAMWSNDETGEGNWGAIYTDDACNGMYSLNRGSSPNRENGFFTCPDYTEITADGSLHINAERDSAKIFIDTAMVDTWKPIYLLGLTDSISQSAAKDNARDTGEYCMVKYPLDSFILDVVAGMPTANQCDSFYINSGTTMATNDQSLGGHWVNHCDTIHMWSSTNTIQVTVTPGSVIENYNVIISPNAGNTLINAGNGLYVGPSAPACTDSLWMSPTQDIIFHRSVDCSIDQIEVDSSCYYTGNRNTIIQLRNSGNLTPGCRYCVTNANRLGGGDVCMIADGTDRLTEAAEFYSTCEPNAGWEVVYDIDNNWFLYLFDGVHENEIKGWTEINRWYNDGKFCNSSFRENYIEDATFYTSGSTGQIINNTVTNGALVDIRNSAASYQLNKWGNGTWNTSGSAGNYLRNEMNSQARFYQTNATGSQVYGSTFSSNSYTNFVSGAVNPRFNYNEVTSGGYTYFAANSTVNLTYFNSDNGYLYVGGGTNSFTATRFNISSYGRFYATGNGTYNIRYTDLDSYGYVNSRGTNGGTFQTNYFKMSGYAYWYNNVAAPNIRQSSLSGYGYVNLNNTNPLFYYNHLNSRGYLYAINAATPRFYYNNWNSGGQMQLQNTTGTANVYGNHFNSFGQIQCFGGTPRYLYNRVGNSATMRHATLSNTVQRSIVENAIYKNLPNAAATGRIANGNGDTW